MKTNLRFSLMTLMIALALIFSAALVTPVYADDGAPPPTDPAAGETTPAVDEPAAPVDSAAPVVESAPVDSAPAADPSVAQIIEQLPEGTDLIVTDASGEIIPLATEEAAQAIAAGDPQWCPVGATPGAVTCSAVFTNFNGGLLTAISSKTIAGVIWIETTYDSTLEGGTAVDFSSLGTTANFALTINGGWSGGNNTIITGVSTFTVPLWITSWNAPVTLNNLVIDAALTDGGADNIALDIATTGNITLNNVTVQDSYNSDGGFGGMVMNGANLNNSGGTGNVVVNNSSFLNNEGYGLQIDSAGTVTIKNVAAIDNLFGNGVDIDNRYTLTKDVTITGIQQFNNNGDNGLTIYSNGKISLANVVANDNNGGGVYLNNGTSNGKLDVVIGGVNNFTGNTGGTGLEIATLGNVLLNNITASDNGNNGAYVDNDNVAGTKTVKLTGTNVFNDNSSDGLEVYSYGAITVNNITASNNTGGDGAHLDNDQSGSLGTITLTGYGVFINNNGDGLEARSQNNFIAANLTANDNYGGEGVYLYLWKAAALTGTNTMSGNFGSGLYCSCYGKVTINNLTANDNDDNGAYISATLNTMSTVTLTGVNTFNGNGFTGAYGNDGLYIDATGIITVSNITANFNYGSGAKIYNDDDPAFPLGVTLSGSNVFNDNGDTGLLVDTYGAILINNLTANGNTIAGPGVGANGAYLDNSYSDNITPAAVTITGYARTSNNEGTGLLIDSWGIITLANITANENYYEGVYISNNNDPIAISITHPKHTVQNGVTITGVNIFNGNGNGLNGGLYIYSFGAILISNVTANGNGEYGLNLNNNYNDMAAAKPISVTGYATANTNNNGGMFFASAGLITLANLTANDNIGYGAAIYNDFAAGSQFDVKLTGTNVFNDNNSGLYIDSYGAVVVNNATANSNNGTGIEIHNDVGSLAKPVTLTGPVSVNDNGVGGSGLYIISDGIVTFGNVLANGNADYGVYVDNIATAQASITITGSNIINGNLSSGLYISSSGTILVGNVTANNNGGYGAGLYNTSGALAKNITLTGINIFNGNTNNGLYFSTDGAVVLSRVTANGNVNGIFGSAAGSVTLTCAVVMNNASSGYTLTGSSVTFAGLYSYNNGAANTPASNNKPCLLP